MSEMALIVGGPHDGWTIYGPIKESIELKYFNDEVDATTTLTATYRSRSIRFEKFAVFLYYHVDLTEEEAICMLINGYKNSNVENAHYQDFLVSEGDGDTEDSDG
tara:strand:- start:27 stop:341 length:315 start_codon:yes stop_codon:yes gene_type:complete